MAHDYIPRRDADFLHWSAWFSEYINNSPGAVGLSALQASQYAALHDAYAEAYAASRDRAVTAIMAKKQARKAAEKQARLLVRIIQAHPGTTDAMRAEMNITVRDPKPTAVARPSEAPVVRVKLRRGTTVRVTVVDANSPRRARPAGVAGAKVYSFIGEEPSESLCDWRHEGLLTRPRGDIDLGSNLPPGAMVWITASWYNQRGQCGPLALPKGTIVQGNVVPREMERELRIAA